MNCLEVSHVAIALGRKEAVSKKAQKHNFHGIVPGLPGIFPGLSRPFPEISWNSVCVLPCFPRKGEHINTFDPDKLCMFIVFFLLVPAS